MSSPGALFRTLFREGRRRRVYTSVGAYLALSIGLIELGGAIFHALLFPEWAGRLLTILLILGLPVVAMLAWMFDIGPGGVTRTADTAGGSAQALAGAPQSVRGERVAPALRVAAPPRPRAAGPARPPAPGPAAAPAAALAIEEVAPDPERVRATTLAHARHELRTPINAIIGYSEMLLEDASDGASDEIAGDLKRIHSAGRDLLARVDRILDPARLAEPGVDLNAMGAQIRADLRDPTTAVIGYAEMLIEGDDAAAMRADLERILGAARRLLDMSTDIVRVATMPVAAATGEAAAPLGATDAIAAGVLAKIQPIASAEPVEERQGSLLVVDDNALNRDLLSRQLARKGYVVATCENGRQALDRLERDRFDVVLLDILMPEIDGVETLRRMKSNPRLAEMPVIMISSLNEIDGAIRCLEMGAADYLTKPFHPTLLDARIGAVLESRRLREREAHYRRQLEDEHDHMHRLALASCPPGVAERVRRGDVDWVESHLEVAALWCDLERGLRSRSALDPSDRAATMTRWLGLVEDAAHRCGLDTVVREGAAVLVAGGVSSPRADAARDVAECALAIMDALAADGGADVGIGIHVGAAFGGVVGDARLSYQLWGEAVEMARALEDIAPAGAICVSPAVHAQVREDYATVSLGVVDVAGGTQMRAWRLERSRGG